MRAELKKARDIETIARRETEIDIVWKLLGEDHDLTHPHVREGEQGIEVNLKYLKEQLSFLSEGAIQQALYALTDRGMISVNNRNDNKWATKWYTIKN